MDYGIEEVAFRTDGITVPLSVLRLDKPDPVAGGNKSFKLRHNIDAFLRGGYEAILTFGGSYSNHIAALAAVGERKGIPVIGLIRDGDEQSRNSITLRRAARQGMRLHFISRSDYRRYRETENYHDLYEKFGRVWVVPEGGGNLQGIAGCGEMAAHIPGDFNLIALAVGTGATFCGLRKALPAQTALLGIKVLEANQERFIERQLGSGIAGSPRITLNGDFTMGGYARPSSALDGFLSKWREQTGIPVEPVYTGRLFYALVSLYLSGFFQADRRILAIHSGGMQYLGD